MADPSGRVAAIASGPVGFGGTTSPADCAEYKATPRGLAQTLVGRGGRPGGSGLTHDRPDRTYATSSAVA